MLTYAHGQRPLHDALRQHARAHPDKPAVIWYGRRISYAELDRLSNRFAQCLRERGVARGDVVVVFLHNCPQYLIAHFGIQKVGAIVSPCDPRSKAFEFAAQVREVDPSVVVAGDDLLGVIADSGMVDAIRHVYSVDYGAMLPQVLDIDVPPEIRLACDARPRSFGFAVDFDAAIAPRIPHAGGEAIVDRMPTQRDTTLMKLARTAENPDDDPVNLNDIAVIPYTSGTTGSPKAVILTHAHVLYKTAASAASFALGPDDTILADTALHHISGMTAGMNVPFSLGATVVLLHRFDAAAVLQAIESCRVTWWYTMAPSLPAVMTSDDADTYDLATLRTTVATSFGIPLTESLARRWSAFANGCLVYEAGYGLSETHSSDTLMPPDAIRWGTNGKPVPGVLVRIVDLETGCDVPCGERGEILLQSPVPFRGYWRRPEATTEACIDDWVRTGDIGKLDADGYLTFLGRAKDMIKVWNYSVSPEEVEAILSLHPDVQQVAVVGCPDPIRGEALHAYVVMRPPTGPVSSALESPRAGAAAPHDVAQRLIRWCAQHMAHHKVPSQVFVRSALPSTCTGKLLRRLLKGPELISPSKFHLGALLDRIKSPIPL